MLLDKQTQPICDQLVGCIGGVLVDHRGAWAAVAHPGHQISQDAARRSREGISGMPQVVKVQIGDTDRGDILFLIRCRIEITASHGTTEQGRAGEPSVPSACPTRGRPTVFHG
jgi:hypothetical protein